MGIPWSGMPIMLCKGLNLKPDHAFDFVRQMRILGVVFAQDLQEDVPRRDIAHIDWTFESGIGTPAHPGIEPAAGAGIKATARPGIEATAWLSAESTTTAV